MIYAARPVSPRCAWIKWSVIRSVPTRARANWRMIPRSRDSFAIMRLFGDFARGRPAADENGGRAVWATTAARIPPHLGHTVPGAPHPIARRSGANNVGKSALSIYWLFMRSAGEMVGVLQSRDLFAIMRLFGDLAQGRPAAGSKGFLAGVRDDGVQNPPHVVGAVPKVSLPAARRRNARELGVLVQRGVLQAS